MAASHSLREYSNATEKTEFIAAVIMEDFPPELYPLFMPNPAAVVAMRCASAALCLKIPRDLFKNTEFSDTRARWESPSYYVEMFVLRETDTTFTVQIKNDSLTGITVANPVTDEWSTLGDKYVIIIFGKFISSNSFGSFRYLNELKPHIYSSPVNGGGGAIKPEEFLSTLPEKLDRTGIMVFSTPVKYKSGTIGALIGEYDDLKPLLQSNIDVCLYKCITVSN